MASSDPSGRGKTVHAYRIVAPRWISSAFSGEGAQKHGGRWNSRGIPVVYLAGSRALAALETLVHLTTPESRGKPFYIVEVSFPASTILLSEVRKPSREEGDAWLTANTSLVLQVPSVLIPEEPNFLLNPRHPELGRIRTSEAKAFSFDSGL